MSRAAKVCKAIRETGFGGAAAVEFFTAESFRAGYQWGNEECAVARYVDGSIAAYFPGRADNEAMVVRGKVARERANEFLG